MITFQDLLNYRVIQKTNDFSFLDDVYYSHIANYHSHIFDFSLKDLPQAKILEQTDIQLHYLENHSFNGRMTWVFFYVTFKDDVVMFCYNSGRDGYDRFDKKIINYELYKAMNLYIYSLSLSSIDDVTEINRRLSVLRQELDAIVVKEAPLDSDASSFVEFYDHTINDVFSSW